MYQLNPYDFRIGSMFIPQISSLLGGDPFLYPPMPAPQLPLQSLVQHVAPAAPPGFQQMFPPTIPTPTQQYGQLPFQTVLQQLAPFAPAGLQQATGLPTAPGQTHSLPGHNPGHHSVYPGYYY